ncbi:MAG: hypothetical protein AB7D35_07490 [Bacteroidales bacterium]|jgi:hypothetical protein
MKEKTNAGASSTQDENETNTVETKKADQDADVQFLNRLALQNKIIHELIEPIHETTQSNVKKPKSKNPLKIHRKSK